MPDPKQQFAPRPGCPSPEACSTRGCLTKYGCGVEPEQQLHAHDWTTDEDGSSNRSDLFLELEQTITRLFVDQGRGVIHPSFTVSMARSILAHLAHVERIHMERRPEHGLCEQAASD